MSAIMEPDVHELLVWFGWFSVLGLLKVIGGLARDRCACRAVPDSRSSAQCPALTH